MILPIYTYGQPVLRKVAQDIPTDYPELDKLIADIKKPDFSVPYLFGFYDKISNENSHAITLVNLENLDNMKYGENEPKYAQIKFSGENVKLYRNGELQSIVPDSDGYYSIDVSNGSCWLITIDCEN